MDPVQARRHAVVDSAVGELLIVVEAEALIGLYFSGHWYPPAESTIGSLVDEADDPVLAGTATQVREYLAGGRRDFQLTTATRGDAFSEQVWALLRAIPYGETTTYGTLAERLGDKHLAQRVGWAVGHNPISIVIPCHRVVGADGSLTGFAGGLRRKRILLELEEPESSRTSRLF